MDPSTMQLKFKSYTKVSAFISCLILSNDNEARILCLRMEFCSLWLSCCFILHVIWHCKLFRNGCMLVGAGKYRWLSFEDVVIYCDQDINPECMHLYINIMPMFIFHMCLLPIYLIESCLIICFLLKCLLRFQLSLSVLFTPAVLSRSKFHLQTIPLVVSHFRQLLQSFWWFSGGISVILIQFMSGYSILQKRTLPSGHFSL